MNNTECEITPGWLAVVRLVQHSLGPWCVITRVKDQDCSATAGLGGSSESLEGVTNLDCQSYLSNSKSTSESTSKSTSKSIKEYFKEGVRNLDC